MILQQIAQSTQIRVEREKNEIPLDRMMESALAVKKNTPIDKEFWFENVIQACGIHIICEVKKASPSKGVIAEEFPYLEIAREYEQAGADCISVLTEPDFFLGKNEYLYQINQTVSIPTIRKDFVIDPYQIYQAKVLGASCVLLICALLSPKELEKYLLLCDRLSISALVETHDEQEIKMAVGAGARMLGVNNRNLKTFEVDIQNSVRLRELVPKPVLFIAESGIQTPEDIEVLRKADVNGVLIGETLMRCKDKKQMLHWLKGN